MEVVGRRPSVHEPRTVEVALLIIGLSTISEKTRHVGKTSSGVCMKTLSFPVGLFSSSSTRTFSRRVFAPPSRLSEPFRHVPARMQSVCAAGCLFVWRCLYDEQSQICMDTVVGILSVFSCSSKTESRDWTKPELDAWFYCFHCVASIFIIQQQNKVLDLLKVTRKTISFSSRCLRDFYCLNYKYNLIVMKLWKSIKWQQHLLMSNFTYFFFLSCE